MPDATKDEQMRKVDDRMPRLEGRTALVMGAGSSGPGWGNGKATAVLFAREGAAVLCADIKEDAARETAELIRGEGGTAEYIHANAAKEEDVVRVVESAVSTFGGIDILDNNVGIAPGGGVTELDVETWDLAHDVNLKSCFLGMKHVIPVMLQKGAGTIINISSVASIRYTGVNYATYYSTKAAMNHLSRTVAAEFASRGIRVNTILPGLMKTPMVENMAHLAEAYGDGDIEEMWRRRDEQVPMGFMGDAWDVARAALFLASDESRYITGIELLVDGGVALGSP
ncbi:glucose 1-dehydrogenase [Microcella alkalica]|uniref:NAD(P)-dependent dehydrogenase (Short-subunit alcohol dehydrogenase family) n=1 Tax=Microcella alkalica TaxID=355930 RepID=A0A839E7R9_9MICO|nr:SDR family oxidoreductase [Microcella alkalica]MBA8847336.1 NAD(P)-dependent dehydrogenase (short-subunit alcohol dehydrogenase family) [Microcella alkalica]